MAPEPWFIAPPEAWGETTVVLPDEESHHALKVLRVAPPDVITVTDGRGTVARCAAAGIENGRVIAEVLERATRRSPRPEVVVYQGAAKGTKLDHVVEKLGELGVSEVAVFESERSIVSWDAAKTARLRSRWDAIARSAAKQSRNAFVMQMTGTFTWDELVERVESEPFVVVLWEEASLPLRAALVDGTPRVALVVGPEGGLTSDEAQGLAERGGQLASLGPHILRTETAPVVATTALLYHYGVIG